MDNINTQISQRFIPAGAGNTILDCTVKPFQAVYPRWRGEHSYSCRARSSNCGLSPLARGTHERTRSTQCFWRFIPAGAGNTRLKENGLSVESVYPRWRGEHLAYRYDSLRQRGLSPLARGTHQRQLVLSYKRRFIPAGAGNTAFSLLAPIWCTVYPRWRGEHIACFNTAHRPSGLSPLARGTQTKS